MTCRILAICDTEEVYADLLTKQLLRLPEQDLQIRSFTTMDQLLAFAETEEITFLVLSENLLEKRHGIQAKVCCCLSSERKVVKELEDVVYIYRYQTTERIYQEICKNECAYSRIHTASKHAKKEMCECIGVFNPVHRNGQTTFARGLSSIMNTKTSRVLYLGMEEYAGVRDNCADFDAEDADAVTGDLMDLLFHVRQNEESASERLEEFLVQGIPYDYIHPMHVGQDIKNVTLAQWLALLKILRESEIYQVIVLDVDTCVQGYMEILESCDRIFVPIREGIGGESKLAQFEENLVFLKKEELKNQLEYTYLPTFTALEKEEVQRNLEIFVARLLRRGY